MTPECQPSDNYSAQSGATSFYTGSHLSLEKHYEDLSREVGLPACGCRVSDGTDIWQLLDTGLMPSARPLALCAPPFFSPLPVSRTRPRLHLTTGPAF